MGPLFRAPRRWFTTHRNDTRRPKARTRLWLQPLERREVPAALVVTDAGDSGANTLRGQIAVAIANGEDDTITFSGVSAIALTTGDLDITGENFKLTIDGDGSVTINGDAMAASSNRIFNVNVAGGNPTITFEQLTLKGGNLNGVNVGAAVLIHNDPVVFDSVTFDSNKTLGSGGAIGSTASVASTVTLNDCTFTNNSAGTTGGAINGTATMTLNIQNSTFDKNSSSSTGGAIHFASANSLASITFSSFTNNSAGGNGGVLSNTGLTSTVTLGNSTVTGNRGAAGGAFRMTGGVSVTVNNSTISGNTAATSTGGAFYFTTTTNHSLSISNSTLANNTASSNGGAIRMSSSAATITTSSFTGNTSGSSGGGLYFTTGSVSISFSTFSNNSAVSTGGGINMSSTGTLNLDNSTVANNTSNSTSGGGGINFASGTINLRNSTISSNTAANGAAIGGAIRGSSSGSLNVYNSTVTKNTASGAGGGGFGFSGTSGTTIPTINIQSSIIAQNFNIAHPDLYTAATTVTVTATTKYSIIGEDTGSVSIPFDVTNNNGTTGFPVDAKLAKLFNYGGPTETHALQSGSPAVDKGTNFVGKTVDQRGAGFPRIIDDTGITDASDGTDIGATEGILLVPTVGSVTANNVTTAGGTSYTVDVVYSDATGIDTATIDINDISIAGFTPVTVSFNPTPATSVTATYTFTPPGGSFDASDNGPHNVVVNAGEVEDIDANAVEAGTIATFYVSIEQAITVTLSTDEDDGDVTPADISLREAIKLSNLSPGALDTISFAPALDGVTLSLTTGELQVTDPVNIVGSGQANTIISGSSNSRIFNFSIAGAGANTNMTGLTLRDGKVTGSGGAILLNDDLLTIDSVTFASNSASSTGGALQFLATTVTVNNSKFTDNISGSSGGAIHSTTSGASLAIANSSLTGNSAVSSGGAVYVSVGSITLNSSTISTNIAGSTSGGVGASSGTVSITLSSVVNNVAGSTGGGVRTSTGNLTITTSLVSGNTGTIGGGVYTTSATTKIVDSTIANNSATSTSGGGGLNFSTGNMTIQNSTISQNTAGGVGAVGGAIRGSSTGTLTIQNTTITRNSAAGNGGGLGHSGTSMAAVTLYSTIVAQNANANHPDLYSGAALPPQIFCDYSLIGVDSGSIILTGGFNQTGTIGSELNAKLSPLGNYGGPTPTHGLLATSPALDQGSNFALSLPTEQRGTGFARVVDEALITDAADGTDVGSTEGVLKIPSAKSTPTDIFAAGGTLYQVVVVYSDETAIDTGTIDVTDISITGFGTADTVTFTGPATSVSATYNFTPPGGSFNLADNGTYTVTVNANSVFDTDGPAAVLESTLGTFRVAIPQTFTVTINADEDDGDVTPADISLREAIKLANAADGATDDIVFHPALNGSTITLTLGEISVTDPVNILGSGASNTIISGNFAGRIFNFSLSGPGSMSSIYNATLRDGKVTGSGGAILLNDDDLTVNGCTFTNNSASSTGGAIQFTSASLTVATSTFSANTSGSTGGAIQSTTTGAVVSISTSTLTGNSSGGSGGAVYTSVGTINVSKSTVSGNTSNSTAGGLNASTGVIQVSDSTITGNSANSTGGGLRLSSTGSLTVTNSTVSGNTATIGGGIYTASGSSTIAYSTIANNFATSTSGGGGLNLSTGKMSIRNSTISQNTAEGAGSIGGAIRGSSSGTLTIDNSTITRNSAAGNGGGLGFSGTTSTSLTSVSVASSIIAQNANTDHPDLYTAAVTVTLTANVDYSIIGADSGSVSIPFSPNNQTGTVGTPLNAKLAPLDNYGGSTETHPLLLGSPALDKGSNTLSLTNDQRGTGFARVVNGGIANQADVGAVEGITPRPIAFPTTPDIVTAGATTFSVTVVYQDDKGIDTSTIDVNDVRITGKGYVGSVAPIAAGKAGSGTSVTATYTFDAPPGPGTFDTSDNGSYTLTMQAGEVSDIDVPTKRTVAAGDLSTFKVAIPTEYVVNLAADVDDFDPNNSSTSLREAVRMANDTTNFGAGVRDRITFAPGLSGATIALTDELMITEPVIIDGSSLALNVVINGSTTLSTTSRIFNFNIPGLGDESQFTRLTLSNASVTGTGGAINLVDDSLSVSSVTFTANSASTDGGAIYMTAGTLKVSASTFTNNSAGSTGSAINFTTGVTELTGSTLTGNTSLSSGGAVYFTSGSLTATGDTFAGNKSNSTGGAIRFSTGKLTLSDSVVSGNTGTTGGGVYLSSGVASITYSTLSDNVATSTTGGGGLGFTSGKVTIHSSTFSQNTAAGSGAVGGGLRSSSSGTLNIDNATFTGNTAAGNGGGLGFSGTSSTTLTNVTVTSSIIAQNDGPSHPDLYTAATTVPMNVTVNNSIIGVNSGSVVVSGSNNFMGTPGAELDAKLGPLQNNGGPTMTHAPMAGSPAFNRGSNTLGLSFDQRGTGFSRTLNGKTDIGAVEEPLGPVPFVFGAASNVLFPGPTTFDVTVTFDDDAGIDISTIDLTDVVVKSAFGGPDLTPTSFVATPNSGVAQPVDVVYTFNAPGGAWDAADTSRYALWFVGTVSDAASPTPNSVPAPQKLASFDAMLGAKAMQVSAAGDVDDGDYTPGNLTIREAMNFANANVNNFDSITFDPALNNSTITLALGELVVTDPVSVVGPGANLLAVSGNLTSRVFNFAITGVGDSTISALTLRDGRVGGTLSGGAISLVDDSLTVSSVTFTNNSAGGDGGAIYLTSGTLVVNASTFSANTANSTGGAINATTGSVQVTASTLTGNTSTSSGGAVYFTTGSVTATSTTFSGNTSNSTGGAIRFSSGTVTLNESTLSGNRSNTDGGALYFSSGTANVATVTFDGNQTTATTGEGGAIALTSGTLNLSYSTLSNNVAASTVGGGGLSFTNGKVNIVNSTLSANTAAGAGGVGGAIRGSTTGTLTIDNSTISRNSAAGGGGGGLGFTGTTSTTFTNLFVTSTIIAQNFAAADPDLYTAAAPPLVMSVNVNDSLIGVHSDPVISISGFNNQLGSDTSPIDAKLAPLGSYGGPTKTHAPNFGSPAIDKGSNTIGLATDQRGTGFGRTIDDPLITNSSDGTDVGAFEGITPVPFATATAPDIIVSGATTQTITVVYGDDIGIDTTTLGNDDLVVSGPGYLTPVAATFTGVSGSGASVTATYTVPAPGGSFDIFDSGNYTITMNANAVSDGTFFVDPGVIGSYLVAIGGTMTVSTAIDEDDLDYSAGDLSLREAVRVANASKGAANTITFDPSLNGQTLTLTLNQMTLNDDLTITGPGSGLLTISGRDASRIFTISDGNTLTFDDYVLSGLKIIRGKAVTGAGGAFDIGAENVTLDDMYIAANSSFDDGGAINVERNGGKFTMTNSTIAFNTAGTSGSGDGGGINFEGGNEVTIKNSSIANNFAIDDGGGLHFLHDTANAHDVLIENTTISANTATAVSSGGGGGGIYFGGTSVPMTIDIHQSTISGNVSAGDGGGIHFYKVTTAATILNTTIAYNTAAGNGGGVNQFTDATGALDVESTIISNNVAPVGADIQSTVGVVNSKNNALGAYSVTTFNDLGGNSVGQDYKLSPLSGFGGPTQTIRPGTTIYVTDKGSNPGGLVTDQRGLARSVGGGVDIGAHELNPDNPYALATFANVATPGGTTYTVTVTYFDDSAIDVSTLGTGDITVYGLNGFSTTPTFKGVDVGTDGTPRIATYEFTPPGGAWNAVDNGIYIVSTAKNQVFDTAGSPNAVYDGVLGGFLVDIPVVVVVDTLADEDDGNLSPGDLSLREAINLSNAYPDATNAISFAPALFSGGPATLTMTLGEFAINAGVSIAGPGADLLTIDGGSKSRIFNLSNAPAGAPISLAAMTLSKGGVSGDGGAITMRDESVTVTSMTFSGNTATDSGGAINVAAGTGSLTVRTSTFSGNTSSSGGAIRVDSSNLLIEGSTFTGNRTEGANNTGGAIRIRGPVANPVNIRNSTFFGNYTTFNGGGIGFGDNWAGTANIDNCTIVGNSAGSDGGGQGGGIGVNGTGTSGTINVRGSIVTGNFADGAGQNLYNTTLTLLNIQHSNIGSKNGAASITTDATTDALLGVDPLLNPLADNGGAVQTMSLQYASPVVDQGFNYAGLAVDAANQTRTYDNPGKANAAGGDGTDIGAFEVQPVPPPTAAVKIDSGTGQRSMIQSITVTFSEAVTLGANPFTVERLNTSTIPTPNGTVTLNVAGSGSTYTITFNDPTFAPAVGSAKSLIDGQYMVTLNAADITSVATGQQLDGDGNGTAGDSQATNFHRLFGDVRGATTVDLNANGFTDNIDLIAFRNANGSDTSSLNYDQALDVNADGFIDNLDLLAFRDRIGDTP